ncbi:hypothetical protein LGN06_29265 [Burkholderia vietnamiensis]|uniref:hypothetical protein n=1 Tax=Burkholderia vietnamiensis TaxID=60552 RepID=UPI001CF0E7F8|nr:hypothetical protein [Burkholderia vietnamiensis]MCA8395637.1 hypothetical protein [Burkholderia vietnamiensis]HDR8961810.1 hypothetical protein [Burkholderia vietnamiensis]HDR9247900.1 hypothetical protein [Burkholderia vietnamiensis]
MLTVSENAFRDYLFEHHKEDLSALIVGRREPVKWTENSFPPIRFLLQQRAERKINEILDNLQALVLTAKELRLDRGATHPTRVDLLGNSESTGLTIIELKKSGQTERQAFTELLAYSNYFGSIFPGLKESAVTSILVAPMEGRTVKDAFVQELVSNEKNIIALIPHEDAGKFTLEVLYPGEEYYRTFERNILNDSSMICVALSFPMIKGWIDPDEGRDGTAPPDYTVDALNVISNSIAQSLEAEGFHALVYANQKWGEVGALFPNPNTIVVAAMNPFCSYRTSVCEGVVYGSSDEDRIAQVQAIYDQLTNDGKEYWIDTMESNFHDKLIRISREQFEFCFLSKAGTIRPEITLPDWYGLKTSFVDAVATHNFNLHRTGLLREIYLEYIRYVYDKKIDEIFYSDDLPKYAYKTLTPFLASWEILSGLGYEEGDDIDDDVDD